jgi:hypothetical protein
LKWGNVVARSGPALNGSARYTRAGHNNSLDASGGSASRNLLGAAGGALIRAAASTQPLSRFAFNN